MTHPCVFVRSAGCCLVALTLHPIVARAQRETPNADGSSPGYHRIRWPLVDFVLRADSTRGLTIYASPNLASHEGGDLVGSIDRLRVDPIEARQWVTLMQRVVDGEVSSLVPDRAIAPVLRDLDDSSLLAIGLEPQPEGKRRYFLLVDAITPQRAWRVRATAAEINNLLYALNALAVTSALAPQHAPGPDTVVVSSLVTEKPEVVSHSPLHYPPDLQRAGQEGRVWIEFVVDTLGRAEADGRVILSDGWAFARESLRVMKETRFRPARISGRAVRVLVLMPFNFRLRR